MNSSIEELEKEKQKLVDIMFDIALTIREHPMLRQSTQEGIAEWVRGQLTKCGFEVTAMGSSHGVLKTKGMVCKVCGWPFTENIPRCCGWDQGGYNCALCCKEHAGPHREKVRVR